MAILANISGLASRNGKKEGVASQASKVLGNVAEGVRVLLPPLASN